MSDQDDGIGMALNARVGELFGSFAGMIGAVCDLPTDDAADLLMKVVGLNEYSRTHSHLRLKIASFCRLMIDELEK